MAKGSLAYGGIVATSDVIFIDASANQGIGTVTPTATLEVEQSSGGGVVAFKIDNNDTDKNAMIIEAANIDADVLQIQADALTDSQVIHITADALTTGSALYIASDASNTSTRNIASIIQDNSSASGSTTLYLRNDHATADALKVIGAVTVGVDGTGHDVKFFGDTGTNGYMLWDQSADDLILGSVSRIGIGTTGVTGKLSIQPGNVSTNVLASSSVHIENSTQVGAVSNITFGHSNSGTATNSTAYMGYISTNAGNQGLGALVFGTRNSTSDAAPTERVRIGADGVTTFAIRDIHSGGITVANDGEIGSVGDANAIAISSGGVVTMTQIPVFSAGLNVSGGTIAGTLATAAQGNVTSLGTLTTLTVDSIIINGTNIGHTSDANAIAISSAGVVTMDQIPVFSAGINVSGGTIAGTLATAAQGNVTSLGTLSGLSITGNQQLTGTLTVGSVATGGGHDVTFYGDHADNRYVWWDASADILQFQDNAKAVFGNGQDLQLYHDGSNSHITNGTGNFIVGTTSGIMKLATGTSGIAVTIGHSTSEVTVADNLTVIDRLTVTGANALVLSTVTNDAGTPTLAFGDGDTGFYEASDDSLQISIAGTNEYQIDNYDIRSQTAGAFLLDKIASTATNPTFTWNGDTDSGLGRSAANKIHIITAGVSRLLVDANGKFGFGSTASQQSQYFFHHPNSANIGATDYEWDSCTLGLFNGTQDNTITTIGFGYQSGSTTYPPVVVGYYNNNSGAAGMGNFFVATRNSTPHTQAPTERFRVNNGGDTFTNDGSISSLSDIRAKKDVTDLTDGLDIVNQLRPRTFKYNGKTEMGEDDGVTRYGFIADEVLSVASQYVKLNKEMVDGENVEDFKTLSTTRFIPMLTKSIQELSAKNDALEAKVTALENA